LEGSVFAVVRWQKFDGCGMILVLEVLLRGEDLLEVLLRDEYLVFLEVLLRDKQNLRKASLDSIACSHSIASHSSSGKA
jgi:hypothetical protein